MAGEDLAARVIEGDRVAIARAITHVESGTEEGRRISAELYSKTGRAQTVGLTGSPGAGKSTLTDSLVSVVRAEKLTVGVIAVDPSSPFSGGAILGDRVRMQDHATDPGVFIRSMATRGHLGGLAVAVPQTMRVLDAAGTDLVIVETVGVGQVEIEVVESVDTTVVVVNPGWGDAIQAAKAGLMEIADIFVINKADRPGADEAVRDIEQMIDLAPPAGWRPPVLRTIAVRGEGTAELWGAIRDHFEYLKSTGELDARRRERVAKEIRSTVGEVIARRAWHACSGSEFESLCDQVVKLETDPFTAAEALIKEV